MPVTAALPVHRAAVPVAAAVQALAGVRDLQEVEPVVLAAERAEPVVPAAHQAAERTKAADERPSSAAYHCLGFTSV
jgi:hypothetical protein